MPESTRSRLLRWGFNLFPAYRGTGARITYIADDLQSVRIRLPLNWRTRNYAGTIFGGSMYGAIDPVYMVMLRKLLGPDYVVWDKVATIRFKKPGRTALYACFEVADEELELIRSTLTTEPKLERTYSVALVDGRGVAHAECEKTLHIARRSSKEGS